MRLIEVLGLKWPKNEVFGLLKKIESLDLAENGLKRCLLLLYNFSPKSHIWQKGVKRGICAQNIPKYPKIAQKIKNYQKGSKKSEKITKNS